MKRSYSTVYKAPNAPGYIPRYRTTYNKSNRVPYPVWKAMRSSSKTTEVPLAVQRYVKRKIALNEEVKQQNSSIGGLYIQPYNAVAGATGWYSNCVFACSTYPGSSYQINQGTGQGDRIGNKIRTKKLVMKFIFNPTSYNATTNTNPKPVDLRVFWLYNKDDSETLPSQLDFTKFFQLGDTSSAPQSFLADMMLEVNKDLFHVYAERRYKLGYQNASAAGTVTGSEYFANNDYSYNVIDEIDLTPYTAKTFTFSDSNSQPNTRGLFCVILAAAADGSVLANTQVPAYLFYTLQYQYTDA